MRFALALTLFTCACTTVEAGGSRQSQFYWGATSVEIPQTQGDVSAISVRTLGIGWDRGPFLGWRAGSWISADPGNCQLLIIIRSPVESSNAIEIIRALEGQNPCIVDYTNSLHQ